VASPSAIFHAIRTLKEAFPGVRVEFHVHNEFGMAMGSVISAAYAGVDGIHSSINALGERTGNVATEEVVAGLEMLLGIPTGVDMKKLGKVSELVEKVSGIPMWANKPVNGKRLFWLESGVVVDARSKMEPAGVIPAMCPYMPEMVGHEPIRVVIGGSSGKASVKYYLEEKGVKATDEQVDILLDAFKDKGRSLRRVLTEEEIDEIMGKVPTGHKMAIAHIRRGEQAVKYAAPIGGATADIAPGEHVHIHNLASLRGKGAHRNG